MTSRILQHYGNTDPKPPDANQRLVRTYTADVTARPAKTSDGSVYLRTWYPSPNSLYSFPLSEMPLFLYLKEFLFFQHPPKFKKNTIDLSVT